MNKDVIGVEYLDGFRLRLEFEGGEQREVDVAELVSFNGVFEPLSDPSYFQQVSVNPDVGTIVWPNGADLCPDVLYEQGRVRTAGDDASR
jgi:hypothetical protein